MLRRGDTLVWSGWEAVAIRHTVALFISQSGRYLRDVIHLGFNRDQAGRWLFESVLSHTAIGQW